MADLTVTIAETATLQGDQSISDSTVLTLSGIISFYHFKGQAQGLYGTNNPLYDEHSTLRTGAGDVKTNLAYLRITNLESDTSMALKIMLSVGDDMYLNLAKNESFIFCPNVGSSYQCAEYPEDGDSNPDIDADGTLNQIIFENNSFDGKHYEVYGAFVD